MGLGNKKGHVDGEKVSGRHTTVIDNADYLVKKLDRFPWLVSVHPGAISKESGGKPSVTIKRHIDAIREDTLTLTFRQSGSVQKVDLRVHSLRQRIVQVVADIITTADKVLRDIDVYDRTNEQLTEVKSPPPEQVQKGSSLLEKWSKKRT